MIEFELDTFTEEVFQECLAMDLFFQIEDIQEAVEVCVFALMVNT